jgi:hypothetical protein
MSTKTRFAWLTKYWIWIVIVLAFVGLHFFGHMGHMGPMQHNAPSAHRSGISND